MKTELDIQLAELAAQQAELDEKRKVLEFEKNKLENIKTNKKTVISRQFIDWLKTTDYKKLLALMEHNYPRDWDDDKCSDENPIHGLRYTYDVSCSKCALINLLDENSGFNSYWGDYHLSFELTASMPVLFSEK